MESGGERELPVHDFYEFCDSSFFKNPTEQSFAHKMDKYISLNHIPSHQLASRSLYQQRNPVEITKLASGSGFNCCQSGDRFIPPRCNQNLDIIRFNLMSEQKSKNPKQEPYLGILSQIKTMNQVWKSRLIIQALDKLEIAKGITNHRVLNFSSQPIYKLRRTNDLDVVDDVWKVKPRKKPLMNRWIKAIDIGDHLGSRYGILDWSSTNLIAAAMKREILIYTYKQLGGIPLARLPVCHSISRSMKICCIKWNHAGDRIVVSASPNILSCWDPKYLKPLWTKNCLCFKTCNIRCIEWSSTDVNIITGCTQGYVCVFHNSKGTGNSCKESYMQLHYDVILNLVISPDDRFIATTGLDQYVRVTLFPDMVPYLEIRYHDAAESLAWHPWQKGMLCIGGGIGDGSISLWNVPTQESLGYRRVDFVSHVKRLTWNQISGELVVAWYYWQNNIRHYTIPVLASWDRVVDAVPLDGNQPLGRRIGNFMWSPDHTILATQISNMIYFTDFFGRDASSWKQRAERDKKSCTIKQKSIFNLSCIR